MKLVSIPYVFSIYITKCQLLLLYITYAFVGRTKKYSYFCTRLIIELARWNY